MKLKLIRLIKEKDHTLGMLFIDNKYFCDIIEDKDRGLYQYMNIKEISKLKVKDQTAIPYGIYRVRISMSPKYKKEMPEILNVPGFTGIRIHSGNTAEDSSGCLIVGEKNGPGNKVLNSRITFNRLMNKIKECEDIEIEIV